VYKRQNLNYPDSSKALGIEGLVYVSFMIDKFGKISNIEIVKGLSPDINREVIRVISKMPDWIWRIGVNKRNGRKGHFL
jgi:protein TonB